MDEVLNLYKMRTETPLECIKRFHVMHPEYANVPMSYAGRLDPMAEGVLVVLVGAANKRREDFLALPKTYRVDILFGFATDTGDALGLLMEMVTRASHKRVPHTVLSEYILGLSGKRTQTYPAFSAKTVGGEALHSLAQRGALPEGDMPTHEVNIFSAALVGMRSITKETLLEELERDISRVRGDFRQKQIMGCWEEHLRVLYGLSFDIATIEIACSSGTYMRAIATELGHALSIPALAYRIVRTRAGEFTINKALR